MAGPGDTQDAQTRAEARGKQDPQLHEKAPPRPSDMPSTPSKGERQQFPRLGARWRKEGDPTTFPTSRRQFVAHTAALPNPPPTPSLLQDVRR